MQETQQAYRGCHTARRYKKRDYNRTATILLSPAAMQGSPGRRTPLGRMGKTRARTGQQAAPQQLVAMELSAPSVVAMGGTKERPSLSRNSVVPP